MVNLAIRTPLETDYWKEGEVTRRSADAGGTRLRRSGVLGRTRERRPPPTGASDDISKLIVIHPQTMFSRASWQILGAATDQGIVLPWRILAEMAPRAAPRLLQGVTMHRKDEWRREYKLDHRPLGQLFFRFHRHCEKKTQGIPRSVDARFHFAMNNTLTQFTFFFVVVKLSFNWR